MIKELLLLIWIFIIDYPRKHRLLDIHPETKYFPIGKTKERMWAGYVIHRGEFEQWYDNRVRWLHLNIHLAQARTHHVTWIGWYLDYFFETLIGALYLSSWKGGSLTNRYEVEALSNEDDMYYLSNYNSESIKRYRIPLSQRKELWESVGKDKTKLKELIKSI
ncbi:MAG: hypothetical protein J6I84_04630 [Bacilli bacterium]|nr:hypothetical protein [Bacilli bacterium]